MSQTLRPVHPEAEDLARLAIGAALLGHHHATIRYNQQLVAWHRRHTDCPVVQARATRTLDHLAARLAAREPAPAPVPLRYQFDLKHEPGELKREVLEALLADARPVTVAELVERLDLAKECVRKVLYRLLDAGVVAQLPAREHRPDAGFRTRYCWTTADRAAELSRAA